MKRLFTLLFICALAQFGMAQDAPDFTVTTVHGEEFNLYQHLEDGKTVVIDIFFVNCPPCNGIAPYLQELNEEWGDGAGDVVFISLTDVDTNAEIVPFEEMHGLTFPASGTDGGGTEAVQVYKNGTYGTFLGYPTISVISPDKSVNFDIWGNSYESTKDLLNAAIEATGASTISSVYESDVVSEINIYPNPVVDDLNVTLNLREAKNINIQITDAQGKLLRSINKGLVAAGVQNLSIDMTVYPTGNYFISLLGKNELLSSFNVAK